MNDNISSDLRKIIRKRITYGVASTAICGYFFIAFANPNRGGPDTMLNAPVEISVGEKSEAFVRRNHLTSVDRQPAGLNFYEIRWPINAMGTAVIKQGSGDFSINHVLRITGKEDMDLLEEGIVKYSINSVLTNTDTLSHDTARLETYAYLQQIVGRGWKILIPRDMPRLRGKDMTDFLLETGEATSLDPSYVPTLMEWMRFEDMTSWEFYRDRVFLTIQIKREHTLRDPSKPGAYLLSTKLEGENAHFRGYVDSAVRQRWKSLVMLEIKKLELERARQEADLIKKGFHLDETYTDPPLPKL